VKFPKPSMGMDNCFISQSFFDEKPIFLNFYSLVTAVLGMRIWLSVELAAKGKIIILPP
jgi:hypothetical protein